MYYVGFLLQILVFTKANAESLEGQVGSIAKDQEASKSEVKEVLQALEELALNYDQKLQEVDQRTKDNENLMDDLSTEQKNRQNLSRELETLQERMNVMTKKVTEITNTLLGELVSEFIHSLAVPLGHVYMSFSFLLLENQNKLICYTL